MLSRRDLITSGAVLSPFRADAAAAAAQSSSRSDDTAALNSIGNELRSLRHPAGSSPYVSQIRDRQRTFFRQYQRFPDYVDVGIRVWEGMHDWHIDCGQEIKISRSPENRYQMEFMLTQLVLRHELADTEIGLAYDR